jgi:hypothetical protein
MQIYETELIVLDCYIEDGKRKSGNIVHFMANGNSLDRCPNRIYENLHIDWIFVSHWC